MKVIVSYLYRSEFYGECVHSNEDDLPSYLDPMEWLDDNYPAYSSLERCGYINPVVKLEDGTIVASRIDD